MTPTISAEETTIRISGARAASDLLSVADDSDARVVEVGSTGVPALEPLVTVTAGGETAFHANCSTAELETIAERVAGGAGVGATDPDAVADHDPGTARLPAADLPGLDAGHRHVLRGAGWHRPTDPADHEAAGGFDAADATAVLSAAADIQGRGWGDICQDDPLAPTWETTRDADGDPVVVVNGHGNPTDALLLSSVPFEVIEGATAAARAVGADSVIVYVSAADERAAETVREAAGNYPDPTVAIDVVTGPAEHRAGEPTMALEAIEGNHRLEARIRPPGPESVGLHGQPTLVHTPRTLAHLAVALRDGEAPDTRLVRVEGDVAAPATVELPESATLGEAIDPVSVDGEFKAACVGGRFGGLTADVDVGVDPAALSAAGLGTEGTVQVLADDRCVLEFVGKRTQFAADENCGRCVPCREGTTQLADLLRDVYDGGYAPGDIEELVRVMETSSICAFGVEAGRPARTAIETFESELQAHADGRCPANSCRMAAEVR
ncbi:NADH-ubiquinone oxidoreductase-F iron-sulfur binding region domain-containing protein [Haloarcula onubensis]|uniref:NADH dehydrogenase FAD-containing subunit n=1 Tax=Haloarcula onubensis TaxID=2950539 RepID=A0ABU2FJ02_9EURY|nr:NADH-ubiquinone oxidoreductase-F iron-sulfur binding region domain-containing protein [Halomicroarcula sp. S3CR25-11]MDS0280735.1 NADH dehydrogenase FAD-containing subunit [Halomicroarcula sp. S3CR25-11]